MKTFLQAIRAHMAICGGGSPGGGHHHRRRRLRDPSRNPSQILLARWAIGSLMGHDMTIRLYYEKNAACDFVMWSDSKEEELEATRAITAVCDDPATPREDKFLRFHFKESPSTFLRFEINRADLLAVLKVCNQRGYQLIDDWPGWRLELLKG